MTQGLSPNTTYIYQVRAKNGTGQNQFFSAYSTPDAATTMTFTDDPLLAQQTIIRKDHMEELRTAANALRAATGLTTYTFIDSPLVAGATIVKVAHIDELRDAMEEAFASVGIPDVSYAHPSLTPGVSVIAAVDVQELRNAVK